MNRDEKYMRIAIDLAKKAEGMTTPNPIVGAVIVKNGKIIGKGYHKRVGLPHAEIDALRQAGKATKGATLYVNLEPCDHFGRTPPCTDAIIESGIRKVIIGMRDPNPINNGRGVKKLDAHSVKTILGVLEEEAQSINRPYIKFIRKGMPYITVKVGMSLDGKIATRTGGSKWITSNDSRRYGHELRSKVDAVMVGVNTVIIDNPLLINRVSKKSKPTIRIIVDSRLKTPLNAKILSKVNESPLIIATTKRSSKIKLYERRGAKILIVKSKRARVDLKDLLKILGKLGISHILVEGGGELIASLVEDKLVDRFLFFIAPKIIGGRDAITSVEGRGVMRVDDAMELKDLKATTFKKDILIEAETR